MKQQTAVWLCCAGLRHSKWFDTASSCFLMQLGAFSKDLCFKPCQSPELNEWVTFHGIILCSVCRYKSQSTQPCMICIYIDGMNAIIDAVGGSTATAWAPSDKVTYWITGRLLVSSANLKQDNFFFASRIVLMKLWHSSWRLESTSITDSCCWEKIPLWEDNGYYWAVL